MTSAGIRGAATQPTSGRSRSDPVAEVVTKYRARIPELMTRQHVPGLAVALVDRDRPLWVQGFGRRDDSGDPVTPDTAFGVQSISKLFTATAVMQAVAAGRLDLDAPITRYLPGFTVHSAFQKHPERLITLRMLLSHTAGFTHEARVGNNNDLDPGTFGAHVRSISDSWLRFPVGSGYAYSNLGIDLAGYILQKVDAKPFPDVMRDSLLQPLGMDHSTFARSRIRSNPNRAVGHVRRYPAPPLVVPMTAAGGLYSSASDLARFLRFELDDGRLDGRTLLGARWIHQMRRVPAPHSGAPAGYALGVARTRWDWLPQSPVLFDHGGGGFGFISDLWWAPQLHLGVAILTNSSDHQLEVTLALSILRDLVDAPGVYRDRLQRLPFLAPVTEPSWSFEPPPDLARLVATAAMPHDRHQGSRWSGYTGYYRIPAWGVVSPVGTRDHFYVHAGRPEFDVADDDGTLVHHALSEVRPGLFLADDGETLDLTGRQPRWANLRLVKVSGPRAWEWLVLGGAAAVAATWLVLAGRRVVRARRRGRPIITPAAARRPTWPRIAAAAGTLTALGVIATVSLIKALPGLVSSGFVGWLDLPTPIRLALHLPLALACLTASTLGLAAWGWRRAWWSLAQRLQYVALGTAAGVLVLQVASWHLIGWGYR